MKKLLGLLWVILIGIFLIGCNSAHRDDVMSLQETVRDLQEQLDQLQAAQESSEAIIAELQEEINKTNPQGNPIQAEYTARFDVEYRNTLSTYNDKDVFQLTIPASGKIIIIVNTDQKIAVNFYRLGAITWFDYTTFDAINGAEAIHFEAGTYLFEVERWYNYSDVYYTIQFNQATF